LLLVVFLTVFCAMFLHSEAQAFTLNVVDQNGNPVSGFRWLVEEDTTLPVTPGALVADSLSLNIHTSYAPVAASGYEPGSSAVVNLPDTARYMVSVLPDDGHTLSGINVPIGAGSVTVTVNSFPVPTAQISVLVFNDNNPINNAPDAGEQGLADFSITISDAAGPLSQDAFGNPLGTTYQQDVNGNFIFDADGNPIVETLGSGVITTDADGRALIKFIPPGKYGIVITAPHGEPWVQTTTIEGTPTIDAWVKAGEPTVLVEFGPALTHIFMGFVRPDQLPWAMTPPGGSGTITGTVVNNHQSAPPAIQGFPGNPISECWIGVNSSAGQGLYAAQCAEDGSFSISGVPAGDYQLVIWDTPLLRIIGFQTVTVPAGGGLVDLGQIMSFAWFGRLENYVFSDADQDGFRDPGEAGIPEQNVNLRFRDGTIYQALPTDVEGYVPFDTVFPFFKWLVVEVDFARLKATGATYIVDAGGPVPPDNGWAMPSRGVLNPQPQALVNPNTGNNLSRTEKGEVLTQGMMLFAGQTNIIEWGKTAYGPGQNGGISGIVFYAITRAENDPAYAAAEPWEPGIPRVQVNLYRDSDGDGVIDDLNGDASVTLADVDNYPFGNFPGPEDVDWNTNGVFNGGDAIQVVTTDSWDDNMPTGCVQTLPVVHGQTPRDCFDNFGTWNQLRPAVFDGGYLFSSYFPGGMDSGNPEVNGLPAGMYIVEAAAPPGYELLKEEDKNVDFGEQYTPSPMLLPPPCVGDDHVVPAELSLFPGIPAPYAGTPRPLCDRKQIALTSGKNAAVDFFFFTYVPKAARAVGFVNNDLAAEGDPNGPVAGEKATPSWLPISFQDFNGNEVSRTYTDEFGAYNALVPSTFTVNIPSPTGVSPNMLAVCLNHPGPIPDPANPGQFITDPNFNPHFSQTCYTLNFQPGTTTYLDTPVIPVAAFVSAPPGTVIDRELPDGTPVIREVNGPGQGGPFVTGAGDVLTITSLGTVQVANPDYNVNNPTVPATIQRDYGFGSIEGTVTVNGVAIDPANVTWAVDGGSISVTMPAGVSTGQLMVTRGDNLRSTVMGITLHVGTGGGNLWYVNPGGSIQATIGAASNGDLIIIKAGTYDENVILWKNVRLQGSGALSTIINALPNPASRLTTWRTTVQNLINSASVDLVPGQPTTDTFAGAEAPGIIVLPKDGDFSAGSPGLIDGLTVTGASTGGGIYANGFAHYLTVSNNRIMNNLGTYGGGIRLGSAALSSGNDNASIHHNLIAQNGSSNGGGGITLHSGSDAYTVSDNYLINNFTQYYGGGILHLGLSDGGSIRDNKIVFNEVFYGGQIGGDGGGIFIGGEAAAAGLSAGAGSVTVERNLLQGNLAGSGSGGGMAVFRFNGLDVQNSATPPNDWYALDVFNNVFVNNVAAYQGGGLYLQDVARGRVLHNTLANNDSTATAADAGVANPQSTPQGAGMVSSVHSADLQAALSGQGMPEEFSNPALQNNIFWQNRSWYRDATLNGGLGGLVFNAYWDLQVSGTATPQALSPQDSILTDVTGYPGNTAADPAFVREYLNTLVSAGAGDEGGNFVNVNMSPLQVSAGDYHITAASPAEGLGAATVVGDDYDGQARPAGSGFDSGADEFYAPAFLLRTLTVAADPASSGTGTITSQPVGVSCGGDCVAEYVDGTVITLTAAPDAGSIFTGWTGGGCSGIGPCVVTMNANQSVTATFTSLTPVLGTFSGGAWTIDTNGNHVREPGVDTSFNFGGQPGDVAVTGSWSGTGTTEAGVYRSGTWYLDVNGNGLWDGQPTDKKFKFGGQPGDIPVTGDWDGTGTTRAGVYRGGIWYLDVNGNGLWDRTPADAIYTYGTGADTPVPGRW